MSTNKDDLSRYTITSSSEGEVKKNVMFEPSIFTTGDKKPFMQYFASNPLWIGVYVILIFVAVVSGVYLFRNGSNQEQDIQQEAPTVTPLVENSPTRTQEPVDISLYSVTIRNGSGISGEAGRAKSLLEENGFTVISTGNADRFDYTDTIIQVSEDIPEEFVGQLINVLETTYTLGDLQALSNTEDSLVEVIIGSSKK